MKDIFLEELENVFNVTIKRLEECTTANEMNLVDSSFETLVDFTENVKHKSRNVDDFFFTEIRDLLDDKKEEYRTAFAKKEYDLMEGKK